MGYLLFALLALSLSFLAISNRKKFIYTILAFGCFPLDLIMPNTVILGLGAQAALLMVFYVILLVFAIKNFHISLILSRKLYAVVLLAIFSLTSLLWSNSVVEGISMTVKYTVIIFFIMLILYTIKNTKDIVNAEKMVVIAGIILILLSILNKVAGGFGSNAWADGFVLTAPYKSPANHSFMLSFVALMALSNYFFYRSWKWLLIYFVFLIFVILAFTRISMMSLVLCSFVMYGIYKRNYLISLVAPLVAVSLAVLSVIFIDVVRDRMFFDGAHIDFSLIFTDFNKFSSYIDTSGRTALWEGVVKHYQKSNAFFGAGSGSTDYWLKNFSRVASAIHSEYLRIYIDLGWLGLLVYVATIIQMVRFVSGRSRNFDNNHLFQKYKSLSIVSLLFYLITMITDNTLNYVFDMGVYIAAFFGISAIVKSSTHTFFNRSDTLVLYRK